MRRLTRLLTPECRAGCAGFVPQVLRGVGAGEGYQVVRWTPRLVPGTLLTDLAAALGSYREISRFELRPLARRDIGASASVRVLLVVAGIDQEGLRRVDRGRLDLTLVERRNVWRFSKFRFVDVVTLRRAGPGYQQTTKPRREALAPLSAAAHRWRSLGWRPAWSLPQLSAGGLLAATPRGGLSRDGEPLTLAGWRGVARELVGCDVDGDGQQELFVVADGADESGLWVAEGAGLRRALRAPGVVRGALCADLDGDARLDLFLVRHTSRDGRAGQADLLYQGDGRGGFTRRATLGRQAGLCACAADLDGDGIHEVIVGNEHGPVRLWRREGRKNSLVGRHSFVDRAAAAGLVVPGGAVTACAAGDVDGDGRVDLYLGGPGHGSLWLNRSRRRLRLRQRRLHDGEWAQRAALLDHDNDGRLDLLVETQTPPAHDRAAWRRQRWLDSDEGRGGSELRLWLNIGRGELVEASWAAGLVGVAGSVSGLPAGGHRTIALAGVDGAVTRWRGGAGELGDDESRHGVWLLLRSSSPGNRDALGARVSLVADGQRQERWVGHSPGLPAGAPGLVHFGVGRSVRVERVVVRWPDGSRERIEDLPVDRLVTLAQGQAPSWDEPAGDDEPDPPPLGERVPNKALDRPASAPVAPQLSTALLGRPWGRATLLLLIDPGCGSACEAHCQALRRLTKGRRVTTAVVMVGGPAPPRAPAKCSGIPVARLDAELARGVAPALPATALIDGAGRVVGVSLGTPRPEQLESDLQRLP